MTQELLTALETGPLRRFADWPDPTVPKVTAGVYTIWDGDQLVYVGMAGRAITANRKLLFRTMDALAAHAAEPVPPDAPLRGPVAIDTITPMDTWRDDWKAHDRARREASAWAADPW